MKFNSLSLSLGVVAATTLSLAVAPSQASAFTISSGVSTLGGALNVTQTTTFNFSFLQSRGKLQSNFGIYSAPSLTGPKTLVQTLFSEILPFNPGSSANKDDFLGTPGVVVLNPTASVVLSPGLYFFGLASPAISGVQTAQPTGFTETSGTFSTASGSGITGFAGLISNASSYTFNAGGSKTQTLSFAPDNFFVALNDPGNDRDVQDFLVSFTTSSNSTSVPEPSLLLGMGLVAGGFTLTRRKAAKA